MSRSIIALAIHFLAGLGRSPKVLTLGLRKWMIAALPFE